MGFSNEWDNIYKSNMHLSIWPWSDLVSLVKRYVKINAGCKILELGCGAGANIPFLSGFEQVEYYAVEGSSHIVNKLKDKFADNRIHIECSDFTKGIPFDEKFDLVVDRSAITQNSTKDIKKVVSDIHSQYLNEQGYFIGVDWHSVCSSFFQDDSQEYETVDEWTRIYNTGHLAGCGMSHFSDASHMKELFKDFRIDVLYEKRYVYDVPKMQIRGAWDSVAVKE